MAELVLIFGLSGSPDVHKIAYLPVKGGYEECKSMRVSVQLHFILNPNRDIVISGWWCEPREVTT